MLTLEVGGGDYKLRLPTGTKRAWRLPLSRASSFNLHLRQQAVITMSTAIPSIACLGVIGRNVSIVSVLLCMCSSEYAPY